MERMKLVTQTKKNEKLCYETPRVSMPKFQDDIVTLSSPKEGNGITFQNYSDDNWF